MIKLKFTKMHGNGNDFVLLNGLDDHLPPLESFAKKFSSRQFGIGFDQLLVVQPSEASDFKMLIFNADGSEVEMCGNGIRCFAKYLHQQGLTTKESLSVETKAGIIRPRILGEMVEVDMGEPELDASVIPLKSESRFIESPYHFEDKDFVITCVSMGNPHCVTFVENLEEFPVTTWGPIIENNELFPRRTNVAFVKVVNTQTLHVRVWERGTGETLACGTGACASLVAAVLGGKSERKALLTLKGGNLKIHWNERDNHVWMTGPATFVYEGEVEI